MPAKKTSKVKENMQTAYENGPMVYTMSKGSTYTLMVVKDEDNDKLLPYGERYSRYFYVPALFNVHA